MNANTYNAIVDDSSYRGCCVPVAPVIKCRVTADVSVCTAGSDPSTASSSDCSRPANSIRVDNNGTTLVTGKYTDIYQHYEILPKVLGIGNYGCVRECIKFSTGQKLAVKSIKKADVGRLDHIRREIKLLLSVKHKNIMKIVDFYEDLDYIHIVTEKYSGGELFDKIVSNTTKRGCLSEREAANIIRSLLEAVRHLHSLDIVHRDIKPENILFESNKMGGAVKLIDFGLARKHRQSDVPMGHRVGTAYYMSPEVVNGSYDRSCDVWAIGVIAYTLLCGYPPFNGGSDSDICRSTLKSSIPFDPKIWGGLSKVSKDFVCRLLCRDVRRRWTVDEALQHPWVVGHTMH